MPRSDKHVSAKHSKKQRFEDSVRDDSSSRRSSRKKERDNRRRRSRSSSGRRHRRSHSRESRIDYDYRRMSRSLSRSRSRTRSRSMTRNYSRSQKGESDFAKLAEVLTTIVKTGSKASNKYLNEKLLPEFDPEKKDLSAAEWLEKINMFAVMYDWDESHKIYLASLKLKGIAKSWYDGLKIAPISWDAFTVAILRQFSGDENFGKLFENACQYKSKSGQSYLSYCFEKIKRINRLNLEIPEQKIVEFVIYGIQDEQLRTSLMTSKINSIAELSQCLGSLSVEDTKDLKKNKDTSDNKRFVKHEKGKRPFKSFGPDECYNCGEKGHRKNRCPKLQNSESNKSENDTRKENKSENEKPSERSTKEKPKCNFCNKIGHLEKECYKKKNKDKKEGTA